MIVYPILQLHEGRCVSIAYGDIDQPTVWHGDPVERALGFVEQGATWLHVTDLGAARGTGSDADLIREIIRRAGVPVQVAGGIRSDEQAAQWIDAGAGRIVIGTNAVRFPDWTRALGKAHPDQVVVAIDVWEGWVMTDGWREQSAIRPVEIARAFEETPLAAIIFTDIDRHLDLPESGFAQTTAFAAETRTPVISSGLVRTIDDVSSLRYMPDIDGVLIGRALYDRSVDLAEAIRIAGETSEKVAEFR